jgi:2-succinyl-5-enolpyruvyl-6-hydroxy-3-cyclohexene-1-carboxylate synthase
MHRLDYSKSHDIETLDKKLADFYKESTQPKLLEIFTPSTQNDLVLKEYINSLK